MTKPESLNALLATRYGDSAPVGPDIDCPDEWIRLAGRASCRHFKPDPVSGAILETLAALALSSPSKSDLQQRDIIVIDDPELRGALDALLTGGPLGQAWISDAPHLVIFCGNNRRHRLIHQWRGHEFVNDHLDAFFNAAVDAGIALASFVQAAEARGLGCCPISAIRNDAAQVSDLLGLPDHVFPVAGLGVGWPKFEKGRISPRLPLKTTLHRNRYTESGLREQVETYDDRRNAIRPFANQRAVDVFGAAENYGWSEDKARQYASPERETFGDFVRAKGFKLT